MIVRCLTPLSTIVQLYHGVSWVRYRYFWSIYPDTSQSVVRLNPATQSAKEGSRNITATVKVFGMTRPGIEPATSRSRDDGGKAFCNSHQTRSFIQKRLLSVNNALDGHKIFSLYLFCFCIPMLGEMGQSRRYCNTGPTRGKSGASS